MKLTILVGCVFFLLPVFVIYMFVTCENLPLMVPVQNHSDIKSTQRWWCYYHRLPRREKKHMITLLSYKHTLNRSGLLKSGGWNGGNPSLTFPVTEILSPNPWVSSANAMSDVTRTTMALRPRYQKQKKNSISVKISMGMSSYYCEIKTVVRPTGGPYLLPFQGSLL